MYHLLVSALLGTVSAKYLYDTYDFDPLQHLAGIAPYFEPEDPPREPYVPQGCNVTKAAYLVRHAAINANDFDYETYLEPFIEKHKNHSVDWATIPELAFLSDWIPPQFSEQEQLTRTGKLEAAQLGLTISFKYPNLPLPQRVWTSTAERTVVSAKGLIRGLETEDNQISLVQVYEGEESGADSLTPYKSCPAYSSSEGSDQASEYQSTYTAPITARLNALAASFNFTTSDVIAMQEMCGYETVTRGKSPFCDLSVFTPDEWLGFEYSNDIMYHYNTGYGNPISGVIGFPWMNNSLQQLMSNDQEQVLYISFTHRELPPTVLVAMGLFNNSAFGSESTINISMPLNQINYNRAWKSSYILPFLSNIAIEKMDCADNYQVQAQSNGSTFYRVVVNDAPQTLPGCFDGPAESCSESGMQKFLQDRAEMFSGFSEKCGVDYSNSTNVISFYNSADNGTTVSKRAPRWGR